MYSRDKFELTYLVGGVDEREGVSRESGSESLSDMTALLPQPHLCKQERYIPANFLEMSGRRGRHRSLMQFLMIPTARRKGMI